MSQLNKNSVPATLTLKATEQSKGSEYHSRINHRTQPVGLSQILWKDKLYLAKQYS